MKLSDIKELFKSQIRCQKEIRNQLKKKIKFCN